MRGKETLPAPSTAEQKTAAPGIPKWALPAVLVFTAILYSRALQNGLTSFDDDSYISANPFLKNFSWSGIKAIFTSFHGANYNPLTTLTFLFEHTLYGTNPLPYHLLNVLLHLVNTLLVFIVARQLSGKHITALVTCILFAVHPMHVESVAWASERKDVLYALFFLLSTIAYLKYIVAKNPRFLLGAFVLFLCSILSKPAAVPLPLLLLAIDLYKGRKISKGVLLEKVPFLLLSIVFGIVNILAQLSGGAISNLGSASFMDRVFLFTYSLSFYIVKFVTPFHFSAMHFAPNLVHEALPWIYYCSLPFIGLIIWLCFRKSRYRKEILFGVALFFITIFMILQLLPVGTVIVAERYTYIPYIGLSYIAGQLIAESKFRNITSGILLAVAIFFSVQTWQRIAVWKNDATLFGDIVRKDTAHATMLSEAAFKQGADQLMQNDRERALYYFTQSILFSPDFGNAYFNRGLLHFDNGNFRAAIADYTEAIRIEPSSALLYSTRGWAYDHLGRKDSADADYNKALQLDPAFAPAYCNKGWMYFNAGDIPSAIAAYKKAVSFDPKNTLAYTNLAAIKTNTGDFEGAIEAYDSLLVLNPQDNSIYEARGNVHLQMKDTTAACADWHKAAEIGNTSAVQKMHQYCHLDAE